MKSIWASWAVLYLSDYIMSLCHVKKKPYKERLGHGSLFHVPEWQRQNLKLCWICSKSFDWVLPCHACLGKVSETFGCTRLNEQYLFLASAAPDSNFATKKIQLYGKEFEFQLGSFQNKMKS